MRLLASILVFSIILFPSDSLAWGAKGHEAVGAIADENLNPHAKAMVKSLIGISLEQAGPWLDCVKDVKGSKGALHYVEDPNYAEGCSVFWDHNGPSEKAMVSFAEQNWDNCATGTNKNPCHGQYHYTDVDIFPSAPAYANHIPGTTDYDVVKAMNAAVDVLEGKAAPAPFASSMDKQEALLMLAHLVGDIHQPLHAGAIYLKANGDETAATTGEEDTDPGFTRGGNWLFLGSKNVHGIWDTVSDKTVTNAKKIAKSATFPTSEQIADWPEIWATDSIGIAKGQLESLQIKPQSSNHHWPIEAKITAYKAMIAKTQAEQVAKAGLHFADLLNSLWP